MATLPRQAPGQVWARGRNLLAGGSVLVMLLALAELPEPAGAAASLSWSGPAAARWSSPGSWSPTRAPARGDVLAFGPSPGLLSASVDDVPSVSLAGISLGGRWSVEPGSGQPAPAATLAGPLAVDLGGAPAPRHAQYRLPTTLA